MSQRCPERSFRRLRSGTTSMPGFTVATCRMHFVLDTWLPGVQPDADIGSTEP